MSYFVDEFAAPCSGLLAHDIPVRLWSLTSDNEPRDVVFVHDGFEYESRARMIDYFIRMIESGQLPPLHVVLMHPVDRHPWYSGLKAYSQAVVERVLPQVRKRVIVSNRNVVVGGSLGAIAATACIAHNPGTFVGMFTQDGRYFDSNARDFKWFEEHWDGVAIVEQVRRSGLSTVPLQIGMTCGQSNERQSNWDMAAVLVDQGHDVSMRELSSGHNFEEWGDALDPYLTRWLQRCLKQPV